MKIIILLLIILVQNIYSISKLNVAVLSKDPNLRTRIESEFSEKKFIQIIDRMNIEEILEEMKLGQLGILKEGTYPKTGELLGAEYLIIIENFGETFKLVHSPSAKIIGSWSEFSYKNISTMTKLLEREYSIKELISKTEKESKDFYFKIINFPSISDNKNLKVNDEIKFSLEVKSLKKRKLFLNIFVYSTDGSMTRIFPNSFQKNNLISTNEIFEFPNSLIPKEYKLVATPPVGEDQYIFIASENKLLLDENKSDSYQVFEENISEITKGVAFQLEKKGLISIKKMKVEIIE